MIKLGLAAVVLLGAIGFSSQADAKKGGNKGMSASMHNSRYMMPPRSNKGGMLRGRARANQVHMWNAAKRR